ncbi:alpha/beta hydrolase [Comamonas endophytica]|uniref:Alpha/beta hydrolase-fold protein n=1 Tax=Comamonas endophytica TaxID=2949090 RepID=A0ABY6G7H5_9BURK|nr:MULTISPECIES: alpha/beta hydrolase-fold protein [unclassified Acidovorax]MCD2511450.1 prolyl oligopeptidase family serine peptidase [Acidovorax sp. D4N7]UYG50841.1 alpha/beta hydrolase-fold protein [Acidovorax sp. 5MLIR]
MMRNTRAVAAALLAGALTFGAWAQEAQPAAPQPATPQPAAPGYVMPSTQVWDMASASGEMYRIFVSAPSGGEPPKGGYPVLYVLDGNAYFGSFAQARWVQEYLPVGKAIVVGVGYPGDKAWDVRRMNDYTAQLRDPPPPETRAFAKYGSGARKEFLDFMTGPLRAEIARRHPVNPERQSLFGHSFGGLFALYALYERPEAFQAIVAASPSMEWNAQNILDDERAFTERMMAGKIARTSRLMVVVGDRDADGDPESGRLLADRLERLSGWGLRVRLRRYPEEVHASVPAQSVNDTLRFAFELR